MTFVLEKFFTFAQSIKNIFPVLPYHNETCRTSLSIKHQSKTNDFHTKEIATVRYDTIRYDTVRVEMGLTICQIEDTSGVFVREMHSKCHPETC